MSSPNSVSFRPLSQVKGLFVKPGRRPLRVAGGLFRGMTLEIDLQHQTQVYFGLYETETFSVIKKSASNAAWAVDVGAGAGELSIYFLRQPRCRMIYAFEPQATEVELFRQNVLLNGLQGDQRLVILEKFAGPADGTKSLPIDQLQLDLGAKGFLKIDVDGYEVDVLESAKKTLQEAKPDVLVEVHYKQLEAACIDILKAYGYGVRVIPNAWWRIFVPERRPIEHNRWIFATEK